MESPLLYGSALGGFALAALVWIARKRKQLGADQRIGDHFKGWAVVTGASSGIGAKIAIALAKESFEGLVLVATKRSDEALSKLKSELLESNKSLQIRIELADLASREEVSKLLEKLKDINVSCLVNNAGFGLNGRVDKLDLNRQLDMVSLNCESLLHLSQVLVAKHAAKNIPKTEPSMLLINVGSLSGLVPALPWQGVYAATKTFVSSLTRSMAVEWKEAGVRTLLLEPGSISDTNFQATSGQPFHKGHLTSDQLVSIMVKNMRYLDYEGFEIIPTTQDRITAAFTQWLPSGVILPLLTKRGRKYTPKELL